MKTIAFQRDKIGTNTLYSLSRLKDGYQHTIAIFASAFELSGNRGNVARRLIDARNTLAKVAA